MIVAIFLLRHSYGKGIFLVDFFLAILVGRLGEDREAVTNKEY